MKQDAQTRTRRRWVWAIVGTVVVVGGIAAWWFTRNASPAADAPAAGGRGRGGPVPIVAATATKGELPIYLNGLGTVTPLNTVTLRARVDGQVDRIDIREGQMVKAGDFIAQIDPRPFNVLLAQAQGQLARDQASLLNARKDLARYQEAGDAISKQQLDSAGAAVTQYEGAVKSDQAQVDSANLQLTYSRITSPIDGRIGLRLVDAGNMVHANDATGLAVITQIQPISIVFSVPQDDIPRLMKRMADETPVEVLAYDRDFKTQLATGTVLAIDNQVDSTSGTVRIKATFKNEDRALFPNQFVNARLLVDTRKGVTIVPAAAIQRGPDFSFVYAVKPDQTVEIRKVTVGPSEGEQVVIDEGLEPGTMVAVDGVDKLQQGSKVVAKTRGPASGPAGKGAGRGGQNDEVRRTNDGTQKEAGKRSNSATTTPTSGPTQ